MPQPCPDRGWLAGVSRQDLIDVRNNRYAETVLAESEIQKQAPAFATGAHRAPGRTLGTIGRQPRSQSRTGNGT